MRSTSKVMVLWCLSMAGLMTTTSGELNKKRGINNQASYLADEEDIGRWGNDMEGVKLTDLPPELPHPIHHGDELKEMKSMDTGINQRKLACICVGDPCLRPRRCFPSKVLQQQKKERDPIASVPARLQGQLTYSQHSDALMLSIDGNERKRNRYECNGSMCLGRREEGYIESAPGKRTVKTSIYGGRGKLSTKKADRRDVMRQRSKVLKESEGLWDEATGTGDFPKGDMVYESREQ